MSGNGRRIEFLLISQCDGESPCKRCRNDGEVCVSGNRKKAEFKPAPKGSVNTPLIYLSPPPFSLALPGIFPLQNPMLIPR